ncbi:MAG TPA: hypothetical protein VMI54_14215 [Polyangiaceae bacterium]|nr:hypothetical protein [Polyangiaceae bacterium]
MKSIYGVIGILGLALVACGGSGDDDSSAGKGGGSGSGGGGSGTSGSGGTSGSTNPTVQKLIDACVALCNKEVSCSGVQIDCTDDCNMNLQEAATVPASTANCDVDAYASKSMDCAAGDCSALSDCENALDTICHN